MRNNRILPPTLTCDNVGIFIQKMLQGILAMVMQGLPNGWPAIIMVGGTLPEKQSYFMRLELIPCIGRISGAC
jgi:hypothetical protein